MKDKMLRILLAILFGAFTLAVSAQSSRVQRSVALERSEQLRYRISFKWGIIRGKLANVTLTNAPVSGGQHFSQLVMSTTGLAESVYSMRDTLETLYGANKLPKRFEKRVLDDGFYSQNVMTYTYHNDDVRVSSRQYDNGEKVTDTLMIIRSDKSEVLDLLSTLALLRTYDFVNVTSVPSVKAVVSLGDAKYNIVYVFGGVETLQLLDGSKRQTMKINININEKNFKKKRNSVTVWLTRDKDLIPVKIVSDISIGAAVIELESYSKR